MTRAEARPAIPLPECGALESIRHHTTSAYDWSYTNDRGDLRALYEKGKALSWNAVDLDWSQPVDLDRIMAERARGGIHHFVNDVMQAPVTMGPEDAAQMQIHINAWMLSQFLHGEQGALLTTAKIVQEAPLGEAKLYAATQVADEARHVEVYERYLGEKLRLSYAPNRELRVLLTEITEATHWDISFLGMQIMVEGLALAAFGLVKAQLPEEPLIQEITHRIMLDESRHVAFGVLALEKLYREELNESELREREDFVIEAAYLMRDRLLMHQVYERLGWDVSLWVDWTLTTPFMTAYRQLLFSKIVPNLRRLGMLTPRVRSAFEKIGILQFENNGDSIEEPEAPPPSALIELLQQAGVGAAAERPA